MIKLTNEEEDEFGNSEAIYDYIDL